ncbi:MAG: flagellar hook-length control protein FliK [Rhizobiales bacterium]|nr:flagellar hook-length control protein FliK [Hyphomicrobiales bacterium]NRB14114.1 flagellar hook-length control protein FliK [Hyphomicrobiales bacterium]
MYQLPAMPKMVPKTTAAAKAPLLDRKPHAAKPNTPAHGQNSQAHKNPAREAHKARVPAHDHTRTERNEDPNEPTEKLDFSHLLAGAASGQAKQPKATAVKANAVNADELKPDELQANAEIAASEPEAETNAAATAPVPQNVEPQIALNANKLAELDISQRAAASQPDQAEQATVDVKTEPQTADSPVDDSLVDSNLINANPNNDELKTSSSELPHKITSEMAEIIAKLGNVGEVSGEKNPIAADKNTNIALVNLADVNLADAEGPNGLKQVIGRILEGLANLSAEAIDKSGVAPDLAAKLTSQFHKIVDNYRQNGASDEVKADFVKFSQILAESAKILNPRANPTSPANPTSIDLTQADQKALDLPTAKANEVLQALAQKTGEPTSKAQSAQNQHAEPQNNLELNKYAGRYNKSNYNAQADAPTNAQPTTETSAKNRLGTAYTAAASARDLNNSTATSALAKINQTSPMDFLSQMQANLGNQQFDAHNQDNVVNVKLAIQNGRLGQNLPVNGLAFQIGKQLNKGNSQFQIRLDPAELGRINVKLTVKQGGDVKVHLVAERNDVFELLQRDARALERALADAGLEGQNIDLEFSHAQGGFDGQDFADNMADENNENGNGKLSKPEMDEDMVDMVANHIPLHVTSNAIDRKI